MRCPSCGADVVDRQAAYCSRCGRPLDRTEPGVREAPPTLDLREPRAPSPDAAQDPAGDHGRKEPAAPPGGRRATRAPTLGGARLAGLVVPVRELLGTRARGGTTTGGWLPAAKAASFGFLATLCVGAVLVVAGKLASPTIGAGASPVAVLNAIVIVALGALGVPISIGDVRVAAVPLGALALIGGALAWAAMKVVVAEGAGSVRAAAVQGAKLGVPYALLMWAAAMIFRFRAGPTPAAAGAGEALLLAALWGSLFGALGGARSQLPLGALLTAPFRALKQRSRSLYLGAQTGAAMLIVASVGAVAGLLLWVIVALLRGKRRRLFGQERTNRLIIRPPRRNRYELLLGITERR
jgi:hypothetical protein